MVRRIKQMFEREEGGLHQAAALLGISAFVSQLLALFRDRIFAANFGAGETLDIYYAAFKIPDFLFVTVASLVSVTILIPFISGALDEEKKEEVKRLLNSIFSVFILFLVIFAVVAFFLTPYLARFVVPGFSGEALNEFILLSRILLLSPLLFGVSNILSSVVQTFRRFFIYALTPILYNVGIIVGAIFLYPHLGSVGLVLGVVLGVLMHALVQYPTVLRLGFVPRITLRPDMTKVREVFFTALPRTLTLGLHQVTGIVLVSLASLMAIGSIAVYNFSYNLQTVPLAIIGLSYSMAAFPSLSRRFSIGDVQGFVAEVYQAARSIVFWALPVTALFIVLRAQVVRTILGSGVFDWTSTRLVAAALALFAISIVAQSLVQLYIRGYYAAGNTKKPLYINLFSSFVTVVSAFWLIEIFKAGPGLHNFFDQVLRVGDLAATEVLVLPLAFSIGMLVALVSYIVCFRRDFGGGNGGAKESWLLSITSSIVMGVVAYYMLQLLAPVFDQDTLIGIFSQGFVAGIVGIAAGVVTLYLLGSKELEVLRQSLLSRFWRSKPIQPAPEDLE